MKELIKRIVLEKCPGTILLVYRGSMTYGVSNQTSDIDFLGICFGPEDSVFGLKRFEQQEFNQKVNGKILDGTVYEIRKFFRLAMNGNPNILESLFVEPKHILFKNEQGEILLAMRQEFLSKRCYKSFCGYAFSQLRKLQNKEYLGSKRKEEVERHGYSLKNAYHLTRLLHMGIQILVEKDLDVLRPERQLLIQIRNGEFTLARVQEMADRLDNQIRDAYIKTDLREKCDYDKLNSILIDVMRNFYAKRA